MYAYYVEKNNKLVIYGTKFKTKEDAEEWYKKTSTKINKLLNRNFILQEIKI